MCSSGYTGQNCESDYIPCDPSPCENGGSCHQLGEHDYECICSEGEYRANFLSHIVPWNLTALRTPNPTRKMKLFLINTYDLLVYSALFPSNLALLCVRITSSKVTGMTAESTRLEDFHRCGLFRILQPMISYSYVEVHVTRISLFPSSVTRFRSTVMNNFHSLLCYRDPKFRKTVPEDFSHGATKVRLRVAV